MNHREFAVLVFFVLLVVGLLGCGRANYLVVGVGPGAQSAPEIPIAVITNPDGEIITVVEIDDDGGIKGGDTPTEVDSNITLDEDDDKGDKDEDKTKATKDDEDYLDGQKKEKGAEGHRKHRKLPNRYGSGKSCSMDKSHETN